MKTANELAELRDKSNVSIKAMEKASEALNELIDRLQSDSSRSQGYILEAVKAEREKFLPLLSGQVKNLEEYFKTAQNEKKFWESRSLLLSMQTFNNDDPAIDFQQRNLWREELKAMPAVLVALLAENAREEENLLLLYQIWLVVGSRRDEINFAEINMNLNDLVIPDQADVLASISICHSNLSYGESIFSVAAGLRINPITKMSVGRQQAVTAKFVNAASSLKA